MADNVTAATQSAGFDRSGGFGATEQKTENSDQIRELLDQVRDLMIEDGADAATAEALTNYARPATPAIAGNLADLMRMGQIAVTGKVDTPVGEPDIEASDLNEAFAEPPAPDLNTGLQTPMGQIDEEGNPTGANVGDEDGGNAGGSRGGRSRGAEADEEADDDGGSDYQSMTKADLQAEADSRGVAVSSSMTKAEMIEALEEDDQ